MPGWKAAAETEVGGILTNLCRAKKKHKTDSDKIDPVLCF